jgi:peptide/nickel transport system permease protein
MTGFLLRRLAGSVVVLLAMSVLVYGLIGLMPGDPIDLMVSADPSLTAADAARLKALHGLDRPLLARWWAWLEAAVAGDLGYSRLYGQAVIAILGPRLGATLLLMLPSLVIGAAIALPLGIAAARRPGGLLDRLADLLAFAAASLPSFWLALLLIVLFAVELGWLPAGGDGGAGATALERLRYLALPVATLALLTAGALARFVRAAVAEALREDFIRTARAKGCSERRVVLGHALGHAMPTLVTLLALHLGALLSGALVVETVFAWPGMGKLIYDAVLGNDFNLALAALLLATAATLAANLIADVAHAWLDPRVVLEG